MNKTNKLAILALAMSSIGMTNSMAQTSSPAGAAATPSVVTTVMPATVSKVGVANTPAKTTVTVTNPSTGKAVKSAMPTTTVTATQGSTTSVVSTPTTTTVTSSTNANAETPMQPNLVTTSDISKNAKPVESTLKSIGEMRARLDEIKLLQDLKEAEYKLSQPVEDKNKKDADKNAANANGVSAMGNIVAPNFNPILKGTNANPGGAPTGLASPDMMERNVTVYSVIGFDGDYSAKVSLDGKSTYTVKKGDVLPDGQMVTEINRYYLVLAEKSAIGRPLAEPQRVYVTGRPLATTSATPAASNLNAGRAAPSNTIGILPSNVVAPGAVPPRSTGAVGAMPTR